MSRLDDELRNAFKREQPPGDFTARVLARVARQPQPRMSWWQRLAALLQPPKLRWVAIGVTASLLLAIGAAQYSRLSRKVVTDDRKVAQTDTPLEDTDKKAIEPSAGDGIAQPAKQRSQPERKRGRAPRQSELAAAQLKKNQELRAEAEAAKDKLMFALSIASSTLNDAQKAVHDDGPKP
ncbi:MAG TPA: hypothetical protein VLM38_21865 [Blastocatellia bacterium]|nr:hypothetical protein [Blastocatellia bacterium]